MFTFFFADVTFYNSNLTFLSHIKLL